MGLGVYKGRSEGWYVTGGVGTRHRRGCAYPDSFPPLFYFRYSRANPPSARSEKQGSIAWGLAHGRLAGAPRLVVRPHPACAACVYHPQLRGRAGLGALEPSCPVKPLAIGRITSFGLRVRSKYSSCWQDSAGGLA